MHSPHPTPQCVPCNSGAPLAHAGASSTTCASASTAWRWPRIFSAIGLALAPRRLAVAALPALALMIAGALGTAPDRPAAPAAWSPVLRWPTSPLDIPGTLGQWIQAAVGLARLWPAELARSGSLLGSMASVAAALISVLCALAIARSAAMRVAGMPAPSIAASLTFAGRWFVPAAAALAMAAAPVLLLMWLGSWIASAAWVVPQVAGTVMVLAATLGAIVLVPAASLVVPAVACEGCDPTEALQRSVAYVMGKPARCTLYVLAWIAAVSVPLWVVEPALMHAAQSATGGAERNLALAPSEADGGSSSGAATRALCDGVRFTLGFSLFCCAGSWVYLLLRRAHDGQHEQDLWVPGQAEAEMAEALRARAAIASTLNLDPSHRIALVDDESKPGAGQF